MSPLNEDFLFAQEAQRLGFVTETQVEEGFALQRRMLEELKIDERLAVILVKRGWIAEEQARRVHDRIEPEGRRNEIQGYRLLEKVGGGAMGTVYKALHEGLQRTVAIKILRRELAAEAQHVERLKEEARILGSLDHPHIVRALDAGEVNGFPFVVMEYVEGETLKDILARKGPLKEAEALKIARGLADALERARRMGVVHRDVKPGNVIVTRGGEPKLMDLGLAKGPVDLGLTQHGATVGTPQYISPEQAQDPRRADTRSDIYSLGATLYAMVTGRPPFHGRTLAEVLTKVLYSVPTPPRVLNRRISAEVSYLIERMMLKDPSLRHRTPADVMKDIDALLAGRSIIPEGFAGNWEGFLLRQRIRRWTKVAALTVAAGLVIGAGVTWYLRERHRQEAMARSQREVLEALRETRLDNQHDDWRGISRKLDRARDVLERNRSRAPEHIDDLERQLVGLQEQEEAFKRFTELDERVDELETRGRYGQAVTVLEELLQTVPPQTPARIRIQTRRDGLQAASVAAVERIRTNAQRVNAAGFSELYEALRRYRRALDADFVPTPQLKSLQDEAGGMVAALGEVKRGLEDLETRYDASGLQAYLSREEPRLDRLKVDFEASRDTVLQAANARWQPHAVSGWPTVSFVRSLLEDDVGRVERAIGTAVGEFWQRVKQDVATMRGRGRALEAQDLLQRVARSAERGGYHAVRAEAIELRREIQDAVERAQAEAEQRLRAIEQDVRAQIRAGDAIALEKHLETALEGLPAGWPLREEVVAARDLGAALRGLQTGAMDTLESEKRFSDVRLADGRTERRWDILFLDREGLTLTVALSHAGTRETRSLQDVHPLQLLDWAGRASGGHVLPLVRAVALVASLPAQPPVDLRPYLKRLEEITTAFQDARYDGLIARSIAQEAIDVAQRQRRLEEDTRATHITITQYISRRRYESAYNHLKRILTKGNVYQNTNAFDELRGDLEDAMELVRAELANQDLAERLPGAGISVEGDRTTVTYDMEDPEQLRNFVRGHAVIEQAARAEPTTPDSATNSRLHLLYGMEGLQRDLPLAHPNLFDPTLPIAVEFDLYTLQSPFLLAVDVDGVQVGVKSADPLSSAYRERWRFPDDLPRIDGEAEPPRFDGYGRGRGVAFHSGHGFRDPAGWDWPVAGAGREYESWNPETNRRPLPGELFAFYPRVDPYAVKVLREAGRITLYVDGKEIVTRERQEWATIGQASDRERHMQPGTGLIQILTWTPQAIDNLRLTGVVLERWR